MAWRLLLLLSLALATAGVALAMPAAPPTGADLRAALEEAQQAAARSQAFDQAAARATDEAARARAEAEALAARIQAAEAEITAAETRSAIVAAMLREQRARLAERQGPLIRLTAALQTISRRPPALALAQPGSLEDAVRVRSVLAATLPRIRERTAALRGEIDRTRGLQQRQEVARAALVQSRMALANRRTALAEFETRQRARSQGLAALALRESDRALALGEEARAAERLVSDQDHQRRLAATLGTLPGPALRPGSEATPARGSPLAMPLPGRVLTGVGELSQAGVHARGLTLAPAADALVIAPARGRVAFAGPFRSYGAIVILDHGGGWTSVVTDLATLSVRAGETVERGAELGRAGGDPVTVELRLNGRPVPITALIG
jgi:murein hydrolase activator